MRDGVEWRRDLQSDAERLRAHYGVTCVVCLVSDHELRTLGVQPDAYRRALKAAGHDTIAFPIVEMAAPESYEATKTLLEVSVCALLTTAVTVADFKLCANGHHGGRGCWHAW